MKKIISATLALALLAGCSSTTSSTANGETGTTSEDLYYVFTTDLATLDYMTTQNAGDGRVATNLVDGLMETDKYNLYKGALAESYEHNDDYTEWTFHLKDASWVTNTGEEYAEVTADDFVAGLQHLADFQGSTLYIATSFISNLNEYSKGKITDFSEVGVEAVDDKTVKYTLTSPTPYFYTVVSYTCFWPINREFLESQGEGCKLGDPDAANCSYGTATDPSTILYNGAYILDEFVSKSSIRMHKNESYYDADNVHINNVNLVYDDGSDPSSQVKGFEQEENPYYSATLLTSSDNFEEYLNTYADYAYTPMQNGYTFGINFNLNRVTFDYSNKTDKQKADTKKALLNANFRKAIKYGLDRVAYMASAIDSSIAASAVRSIECPWNFVSTSDGKSYGELVQAASEDPTVDLSEGQDSIYDVDKAQEYLEKAKKELTDVEWPIVLDLCSDEVSATSVAQCASLEQSIEDSLGSENVDVVVHPLDDDSYTNISYTSTGPEDADWDINTSTGWGADYVDPKTYLNIFSIVDGDVTRTSMSLEYYQSTDATDENDAAIEKSGLLEYQELLDAAYAITDDMDARYEAEAKAEAYLLDNALFVPIQTQTISVNWTISRAVPFSGAYQSYKYKGLIIQKDPITAEQYADAKATWETERVEAAKAAAE